MIPRRPSIAGTALIASALIALIAMLPDVPVPVRALAIVGFVLVCPGLAWIRLLGIQDRLAEWTLGVALSISIATIVASIQAYTGAWSPRGMVVALAILVLAAVATELVRTPKVQEER
jgi:hypothetical protein